MDLNLLADLGYSHHRLLTPDDEHPLYNSEHKRRRVVVEILIGLAKLYGVANSKFRSSPEMQFLSLNVIYQLVQCNLLEFPLQVNKF